MDNLCHTLVGAAIGEAGLKQRTRFGNAALMIAANLPDLDVLVFLTGAPNLSFRRGWTHGIAAQIALPIALTGVFWAVNRMRPADASRRAPPFHAGWLLLLAYVGVYSHVFLDLLNNYGIRLLTPFDWRWFYGDALFIIDLWLWIALGAGVWLSRRRRTLKPARWMLTFAACYIAAMVVSARMARDIVADSWQAARGTAPRALMVGPQPLTPFLRDVIIDAGDRYQAGDFDWRTRAVMWESAPIPKNDQLPEVAMARSDPSIRAFLVWSRFPFWQVMQTEQGTQVTVGDMRFRAPARFVASTVIATKRL